MQKERSQVILVDPEDNTLGVADKITAHQQGLCHRAFSVFLFHQDENGQLWTLLQQRQNSKYHCPGLWSNACCSHPQPEEPTEAAARARLFEELGYKHTGPMTHCGFFHYKADCLGGLIEHEVDHVFYIMCDAQILPPYREEEVRALKWMPVRTLQTALEQPPDVYTPWLKQALEQCLSALH